MSNLTDILRHPGFLLGSGLTLGAVVLVASTSRAPRTNLPGPSPVVLRPVSLGDSPGSAALHQNDKALVEVIQAVSPAVVNIDYKVGGRSAGTGSGFVYRSDGWIVTNDHVVGDRAEVNVTLQDGRTFSGKVTGANDSQYDVAVLKIDAKDLPSLSFADSDLVKPGQTSIAVGSPYGLESTVTIGHVSAVGRGTQMANSMQGSRAYSGMIQTDAAINPGNSGGPLMDIDGNVIGVNSMIYSNPSSSMLGSPAGSVGIGFAISSNVAKTVADKLIATGKLERAFLGAAPSNMPLYKAKEAGLPGAAILTIDEKMASPAREAGLKTGDVVTAIDADKVENEMDVREAMLKRVPGAVAKVAYLRDGKPGTASVKLGAVPAEVKDRTPMDERLKGMPFERFGDGRPDPHGQFTPEKGEGVKLGATVHALDSNTRSQFKIPAEVRGLVVMALGEGLGRRAGLEVGDVILSVNGTEVNEVEALRRVLAGLTDGETVEIVAESHLTTPKKSKRLTIRG